MSEDLGLSIARSLTTIVILYRDLEDEAQHKFADKEMPGGDALVMLGPVANMEAYNYRQLSELMGRTNGKGGYEDPCVDEAPPLLVLASWHDVVRQERGLPDSTKRATITREADGIRASIDWMLAEDEHGTPNFMPADELAKDLRRVVYRLERILKAGNRDDTSAVACFNDVGTVLEPKMCGGRLFRRTLNREDCQHVARAIAMAKDTADPVTVLHQTLLSFPEDELAHRACEQGGRDDIYRCRDCEKFYTEAEYWLCVKQHYEREAG